MALPLGELLIGPAVESVFAPQQPPPDYVERAAAELILRPRELIANAEDLMGLKAFVTAQAPHYGEIQTPTIVIAGDVDKTVSPDIHAKHIAAVLPHGQADHAARRRPHAASRGGGRCDRGDRRACRQQAAVILPARRLAGHSGCSRVLRRKRP